MTGVKHWKLVTVLLLLLTVTLAIDAWANGPGGDRGGPGGDGGFGPHATPPVQGTPPVRGAMNFGQLVEQLIFPCRNDCVQAERSCTDTAGSAALSCATQTCETAIQTAQTDCAASRSSQSCLTDVSALITCVQPCLATQASAVSACLATFKTCVAGCSPTPTP